MRRRKVASCQPGEPSRTAHGCNDGTRAARYLLDPGWQRDQSHFLGGRSPASTRVSGTHPDQGPRLQDRQPIQIGAGDPAPRGKQLPGPSHWISGHRLAAYQRVDSYRSSGAVRVSSAPERYPAFSRPATEIAGSARIPGLGDVEGMRLVPCTCRDSGNNAFLGFLRSVSHGWANSL
jgi:hypothetical protein